MKKTIFIELFFLLATFVAAAFLFWLLIDNGKPNDQNQLNFSLHDSVFILNANVLVPEIWMAFYFMSYLLRQMKLNFRNGLANFLFIFSTLGLMYFIHNYIKLLKAAEADIDELNGDPNLPMQSTIPTNATMYPMHTLLWALEGLLLVLIVFVIYRTFRKFKKRKK